MRSLRMERRILAGLVALLLGLAPCGPAAADELPTVVDRIGHPKQWTDFAFDPGAELMTVCFPPIRDCDAALILCGGESLLLDCASREFDYKVTDMLEELGVTRIDTLVITHPHPDHWMGLPAVAEKAEIGRVAVSFPEHYSRQSELLAECCASLGIPVVSYGDGDTFTVGGAVLTVFDRVPERCDCNDRSAQMLLRYGERTLYFSADIEAEGMAVLAASAAEGELRADILKYPHHGKAALQDAFAAAVSPVFAVVTNKDRGWGGQVWLRNRRIPYVNTRVGGVVLTTDGGAHWLAVRLYGQYDPRGR